MRQEYKWRVAIIAALGLFMAVLDNNIVTIALPQMQQTFRVNVATITWVVTAYFLAQAAIIPVAGYVGDKIGTWRAFLLALTGFTVGSALCAFAPSGPLLIAFRVIQGVFGGGLFPVAFAIVYRVFPPDERGKASAIIGAPVLLAPAIGPTIGGLLTGLFHWNAIFAVNIPIGIVTLLLTLRLLRKAGKVGEASEEPLQRERRMDVVGLLLAMLSFTVLVSGISLAGTLGWGNVLVERLLLVGVGTLVAFVVVELRVDDPVIDIRLFLNYTFSIANLLTWAVAGLLFGGMFLLPFFFENVQHLSPLTSGEWLIAQGVATAIGTVLSGMLYNRVGPRIIVASGFLLMLVGTLGLTRLTMTSSAWSLQAWLILRGLGLGLSNIPLQTLALSVVRNEAMGRASSLLNVTRQLFGAMGIAVLSAYLSQQTHIYTALFTAPHNQQVHGISICGSQAVQHTATGNACLLSYSTTLGLNNTFMVMAVCSGVCIVLALFIGRDPAIARKTVRSTQQVEVPVDVPQLSQ